MQNKGLIKFFAILFALVSIYQLSFTFVSNKVKSDAKSFAAGNPDKELKYLDSIGKENVFNLGFTKFTFNEVKDKQINKGLDLEGGINVILQISVKDVLKGLANNSKNPVFNKSLADATANMQGNNKTEVRERQFVSESRARVTNSRQRGPLIVLFLVPLVFSLSAQSESYSSSH